MLEAGNTEGIIAHWVVSISGDKKFGSNGGGYTHCECD
jgi:hypothetical protein